MLFRFKATIYKIGINWAVDVPSRITKLLAKQKGYIHVDGTINSFPFSKSLVPVKDKPYRLFVNGIMMKGANTSIGATAYFELKQGKAIRSVDFPMPPLLTLQLKAKKLFAKFNALTPSRKKDILRYLSAVKTDATLAKNIEKLIAQLSSDSSQPRIP